MNESLEPMPRDKPPREPMMTAREVARYLGTSAAFVYQHANGARKPLLVSYKFGALVRFKKADVDDFVERLKRSQPPWTIH